MRPQITAYLHLETKQWLEQYAAKLKLPKSEVVRLLVEREQQVGWLKWALETPDPAMGPSSPMPKRSDKLPVGWNKPPLPPKRRRRAASGKRSPRV